MNRISRRVLVVDDNPAIHQDFRKILGGATASAADLDSAEAALFEDVSEAPASNAAPKFQLDFASQGEQALELVKRALADEQPYAFVFMDVRMPPGWDGIETTAKLWEVDPHLQVAFCTAYSDYSWEKMAGRLKNIDSFVILKKPFDVVEVLQLATAFTAKWNLTQEKQAQLKRLEESESRYQLLTNAMPGLVWTAGPTGELNYVNEQAVRYFGVGADELLGSKWQQFFAPEEREAASEIWKGYIAAGQVFETECRLRRVDGVLRWHLGRAHPLRNEQQQVILWVGTLTDIEDRKRAEEELRSSQAELEKRVAERTEALARERDLLQILMDHVPDSIYFKDVHSRFTRINRAHANFLGLQDPEQAVGKTDASFLPSGATRQTLVDENRMFATGEPMMDVREQYRTPQGDLVWLASTKVPLRDARGNFTGLVGISRNITERMLFEEKLAYERELLRMFLDHSPDFIYFKDAESRFLRASRTLAAKFGVTPDEMIGKSDTDFFGKEHAIEALNDEQNVIKTGEPIIGKIEQERIKGDGRVTWVLTTRVPLRNPEGKIIGTFGISKDITAIKEAENGRQMMELQLRQSQKLEAIGQLAAGIAHEINTPTQYVGDNTRFLKDAFESIVKVVNVYGEMLQAAKSNSLTPELVQRAESAVKAGDLEYLFEQVPAAVRETLEGVERVTKIVRAMKEFSHPGGKEKSPADLNRAIETTVTVARNEWKYVSEVVLDLDPALPLVPCLIGEFNQVILNLVVNASHAIGDVVRQNPGNKGTITVKTRRDGEWAEIRVTDTGTGIPEAVRPRIFEPFFTTKDVGKGSGQGLALVYGSIVRKHGGSVTFETEAGRGTTFILRLPVLPSIESKTSAPTSSGNAPKILEPAKAA